MGSLPVLLSVALVALIVFIIFRKKASDESVGPQTDSDSDMILDRGQQRLHMAMKKYLLEEMQSEDEWRAFDFLRGLLEGSKLERAELVDALAAEFDITEREASQRLTRVEKAVQEVRKKAKAARD